jgi:tetratricopeptide (TPR) repeat protein
VEFYNAACSTGIDGRRDLALTDAERALDLALLIGDRYAEAQARHNVGWAAAALGDNARAVNEYERVIETYAEIGHVQGAAGTIFNLAAARGWCGDYDGAFQLLDQLDSLALDQPWIALQAQAHRGSIGLRAGQLATAERHLLAAAGLSLQLGTARFDPHLRACLGELKARQGRFAEARDDLDAAATQLDRLDSLQAVAEVRAISARVHAEMHDEPAARASIAAATTPAGAGSGPRLSSKFWWDLAAASASIGDAPAASDFARTAARIFCEEAMGMRPDLAESYGRLPWNIATFAYLAGREVSFSLTG